MVIKYKISIRDCDGLFYLFAFSHTDRKYRTYNSRKYAVEVIRKLKKNKYLRTKDFKVIEVKIKK